MKNNESLVDMLDVSGLGTPREREKYGAGIWDKNES